MEHEDMAKSRDNNPRPTPSIYSERLDYLLERLNSPTPSSTVRVVPRRRHDRAPSSPSFNIPTNLAAAASLVPAPALQVTSNCLPSSSTALSCEALGTCAQATGFAWPSTSTIALVGGLAFALGITAATFAYRSRNNQSERVVVRDQQSIADAAEQAQNANAARIAAENAAALAAEQADRAQRRLVALQAAEVGAGRLAAARPEAVPADIDQPQQRQAGSRKRKTNEVTALNKEARDFISSHEAREEKKRRRESAPAARSKR